MGRGLLWGGGGEVEEEIGAIHKGDAGEIVSRGKGRGLPHVY